MQHGWEGVVELDASVMVGSSRAFGAVGVARVLGLAAGPMAGFLAELQASGRAVPLHSCRRVSEHARSRRNP